VASNFSNYFQKAYTRKPHFDELVYGFNGTSGSQRMDGSKQAVGYVDYVGTGISITRSTLNNDGFSITGSYYGTPTTHISDVKIDVDNSYTDGQYYISSSNEVWLRLNASVISGLTIRPDSLMSYLASVINIHRLSPSNTGPPIIATSSGSSLILTQVDPGPAGNVCMVTNLGLSADFEFTDFSGGDGIGGGPYAISWAPVTGTAVATGVRIESSYVLSPVRHGQLTDTFYAPPDHYVYGPREVPLVKSNFTGSIVISSNRDEHSRIFSRYQDGDPGESYTLAIDPTFTPLS
jgi:hypothetical protein